MQPELTQPVLVDPLLSLFHLLFRRRRAPRARWFPWRHQWESTQQEFWERGADVERV